MLAVYATCWGWEVQLIWRNKLKGSARFTLLIREITTTKIYEKEQPSAILWLLPSLRYKWGSGWLDWIAAVGNVELGKWNVSRCPYSGKIFKQLSSSESACIVLIVQNILKIRTEGQKEVINLLIKRNYK